MQTLKLENYETLCNECMFLSGISPNVSSSGQLIAGPNNYPSSVSGVSIDYLKIRQLTVEQGEMFTENDIQTAAKVCVIGKTIVSRGTFKTKEDCINDLEKPDYEQICKIALAIATALKDYKPEKVKEV